MSRHLAFPFFLVALLVGAIGAWCSQADDTTPDKKSSMDAPQYVVPARTIIPLVLKNAINSRTATVGQAVYSETIYPITIDNHIVIPVGSYVKGSVTEVTQPGRVKGRAQVGLRFDTLTLPNGVTQSIRATLASYSGSGEEGFNRDEGRIEGKSTKGKDVEKVATTATQGTVIGGLGSRSGKGAGIGALSGGAAGLIWVLATKGDHVVLPPGTNFEVELATPLHIYRTDVEGSPRYDAGPALPRSEGPAVSH